MRLEADGQDQVHNLQGKVQNENSSLLFKNGKSAIVVVKI